MCKLVHSNCVANIYIHLYIASYVLKLYILEISVILPYIIGENLLLCSNDNLIVATQESTVFCQIQGCMNCYSSYVHACV